MAEAFLTKNQNKRLFKGNKDCGTKSGSDRSCTLVGIDEQARQICSHEATLQPSITQLLRKNPASAAVKSRRNAFKLKFTGLFRAEIASFVINIQNHYGSAARAFRT